MAKKRILTEQEMSESKKRFQSLVGFQPDKPESLLEFKFVNDKNNLLLDEDDDDPNAIPDPNNPAPAPSNAAPAPGPGPESQPGEAPAPAPEASNEPEMSVPEGGVQGNPVSQENPMPMEAPQEAPAGGLPSDAASEGGDVEIDVTDLTQKQDDVDNKVTQVTSQTQQMMDMLSKLTDKVQGIIQKTDVEMANLKDEMIKRNPTPVQVLNKRLTVSDPFTQTPEDYWKKKEAEGGYKLSDDDDQLKAQNDQEFEIKASDIDDNKADIYKSFGLTDDEMNQSLANMFRM